jgi:DNA-binding GntR family transcriptional regulator
MGATGETFPPIDSIAGRATRQSGATARVVEGLRQAIVTLELEPGAKLDKAELTRRFGVSRFPVAEALNRLKAEGLVDIRPQSGSTVSRIRLADARENMFLRHALEGEAVAHHARRHSRRLLGELRRNMQKQKVALDADDRARFHRLDLELHDIFVSTIGYARVRTMVEGARLSLDRARRLLINPRRHALTFKEHAAIVAAIAAGDPSAARSAMSAHLDSVMEELEDFARECPALFDGD